jgi:hypothetical protein
MRMGCRSGAFFVPAIPNMSTILPRAKFLLCGNAYKPFLINNLGTSEPGFIGPKNALTSVTCRFVSSLSKQKIQRR